jgi:ribonuclease P protein subunit RPR2
MKHNRKIALERIYRLFELAGLAFSRHPERSRRYVGIARLLGTRNRVRIPQELRLSFCKKCGSFLSKSNSEAEISAGIAVLTCRECGHKRKMRWETQEGKEAQ